MFAVIAALAAIAGAAPAGVAARPAPVDAVIADGGKTDYVIAIADTAGDVDKLATEELQNYLQQISGAKLEIVAEKEVGTRKAILVGNTKRGEKIVTEKELKPLGGEGFILREKGGFIAIRGGGVRGTLYGVVSLLEDNLGVRWYTPDSTVVPKKDKIDLAGLNVKEKPAFEYREPFFHHAFNQDWAVHNRANGNSYNLDEKHGDGIKYMGFVHTLPGLVPKEKYFKDHPEYFALIDGKRLPDRQLCMTNPDVLKIVTDRVMEMAESAHGKQVIISVSQNDNVAPCRCPRCLAMDKEEGSPSGTLLRFVNQVAAAVAKKYPNVAIDTLAYQYTEKPPRITKPLPNVIVRLCHMAPSCDTHPLGKCYLNKPYVRNLNNWSKISDRLYVWHYVTNFAFYPLIFPDLNAIVKDMDFYSEHHVKGLFAQGSYQSYGGDMAELKAWVIAKLLWNPKADAEALIRDFVEGYYGPASPAMMDFINAERERVRGPNMHANLYSSPRIGYLNYELTSKLSDALDRAEKLAASDPAASEHVRMVRLWLTYTRLQAPELFFPAGTSAVRVQKGLMQIFESFKSELAHFNVTVLREGEPLETSLQRIRLSIIGWKD